MSHASGQCSGGIYSVPILDESFNLHATCRAVSSSHLPAFLSAPGSSSPSLDEEPLLTVSPHNPSDGTAIDTDSPPIVLVLPKP